MFSTEYFIVLHDIIDDIQYVFNTTPVSKEEGFDAYHKVFRIVTKNITNKTVSYNIENEECEVFVTEDVISKGWLWNSSITRKNVIYKMRLMPCYRKRIQDDTDVENDITDSNAKDSNTEGFTYGLGYANTLLFPTWRDQFKEELEKKFKQMEILED